MAIEIRPPAESDLRAAMEAATLLSRTELPPHCPEVF